MSGRLAIVAGLVCVLWGCAESGEPIDASGRVVRSEHGLAQGTECRVRIDNESRGGYPCRVSVECGGRALYGASLPGGYAACQAEDARWLRAHDRWLETEDGDPYVDYDVGARTVVVRTARGETVVEVLAEVDESSIRHAGPLAHGTRPHLPRHRSAM